MRGKNHCSNQYYIYSKHASIEAIMNFERKIHNVFMTKDVYDTINKTIIDTIKTRNLAARVVTRDWLDRELNTDFHQGIAVKVDSIAKDFKAIDLSKINRVVILDQISDPNNFGAILRSSAFFGIDLVVLPKDNSVRESASVAKVSCGGLECVDICYVTNIVQTIAILKKNRFWILGLDEDGETLDSSFIDEKIAIVMGSEGSGMRQLTRENCDKIYKISSKAQKGNVSSINVSSAAAIALYELTKG